MTITYKGPATVTAIALYRDRSPTELTTLEWPVVLSNTTPGRARIDFSHYLHGPKHANALRVVLPDAECCTARLSTVATSP